VRERWIVTQNGSKPKWVKRDGLWGGIGWWNQYIARELDGFYPKRLKADLGKNGVGKVLPCCAPTSCLAAVLRISSPMCGTVFDFCH